MVSLRFRRRLHSVPSLDEVVQRPEKKDGVERGVLLLETGVTHSDGERVSGSVRDLGGLFDVKRQRIDQVDAVPEVGQPSGVRSRPPPTSRMATGGGGRKRSRSSLVANSIREVPPPRRPSRNPWRSARGSPLVQDESLSVHLRRLF